MICPNNRLAQKFHTNFQRLFRFFRIKCSHTIFVDVAYRNFKAERERISVVRCEVSGYRNCWCHVRAVIAARCKCPLHNPCTNILSIEFRFWRIISEVDFLLCWGKKSCPHWTFLLWKFIFVFVVFIGHFISHFPWSLHKKLQTIRVNLCLHIWCRLLSTVTIIHTLTHFVLRSVNVKSECRE